MDRTYINNGEARMVELNKGKRVNVNLLSDEFELYIHGGDMFQGQFRYVMHKAKNPRSEYQKGHENVHANVNKGWFIVDPMRIIL